MPGSRRVWLAAPAALAIATVAAGAAWGADALPAPPPQAPAPVVVQVLLGDRSIRTDVPSVPGSVPVQLVTRNAGSMSHQLALTAPNARGAILAPGESHTIELVFGAPGT